MTTKPIKAPYRVSKSIFRNEWIVYYLSVIGGNRNWKTKCLCPARKDADQIARVLNEEEAKRVGE